MTTCDLEYPRMEVFTLVPGKGIIAIDPTANDCRKTQTKVITSDQSQRAQITPRTNQSSQ